MASSPPIEELLPTPELLDYYKTRVDDFEDERQELMERVERCGVDRAHLHKLEWETRKRADEIYELQKALSDAHTYLFEERERLLQLQAENDALRLQEMEDRKKIQHLLALMQPGEQEITYARDSRPDAVTVFPRDECCGHAKACLKKGPGGQERVMRTVYLPTANANALLLKVESLQAQLNEQRQFASERIAAVLDDRRVREQDDQRHRVNFQQQIESQAQKIRKLEEILAITTRDYILARQEKQKAESQAATAESSLSQLQTRAARELTEMKKAAEQEVTQLKEYSQHTVEDYVKKFRAQVRQREEEVTGLESLHNAMKAQYECRIEDLEKNVFKHKAENKRLERRRALDLEGFTSGITMLRKQLAAVDRKLHQMRLVDRLEHDERLEALLKYLEKKAPAMDAVSDAGSRRSAASEIAAELGKVKGAILGMEGKLISKVGEKKGQ